MLIPSSSSNAGQEIARCGRTPFRPSAHSMPWMPSQSGHGTRSQDSSLHTGKYTEVYAFELEAAHPAQLSDIGESVIVWVEIMVTHLNMLYFRHPHVGESFQ